MVVHNDFLSVSKYHYCPEKNLDSAFAVGPSLRPYLEEDTAGMPILALKFERLCLYSQELEEISLMLS